MILKSKTLAALVVAIMFSGIIFSSAMGWWQTESTKVAAVFTNGEFAGQANPADIRGSFTFGDVQKNFAVPVKILAEAFGVQASDLFTFQVKSLEEMYANSAEEIGTASVRLFVAFYKGLPFDLSTDIYLPEAAAALLRTRGLSNEQADYLEAHTLPHPSAGTAAGEPGKTALPPDEVEASENTPTVSDERLVKGKTTFAELLEWGVSKETIEKVLGMPMPAAPGTKVKDYCTEKSLSFETIKTTLQAEVDLVK